MRGKYERSDSTVVVRSLPPSRAGKGRIFTTQRFTERRAITSNMRVNGTRASTISINVAPTPIGPERSSFASSRSVGVLGAKSFLISVPNISRVSILVLYVSRPPITIALNHVA